MILRLDLHVHSDRSPDGRSSLDALIRAARAGGLDGFALADHDLLSCAGMAEDLLVVPACECSTRDGHILALCIDRLPQVLQSSTGRLPTAREAIDEIHRLGGVAVWAHPYERHDAIDEKAAALADAIETANGRAVFKRPQANAQAAALARRLGKPQTGGSDAHHHSEIGNVFTVLDCKDKTLDSIKQALLAGNCTPIAVRDTPRYKKGLSQLCKCRRNRIGPGRLLKALAYLVYCFWLDLRFHIKKQGKR